jgi:hypothetical protein
MLFIYGTLGKLDYPQHGQHLMWKVLHTYRLQQFTV